MAGEDTRSDSNTVAKGDTALFSERVNIAFAELQNHPDREGLKAVTTYSELLVKRLSGETTPEGLLWSAITLSHDCETNNLDDSGEPVPEEVRHLPFDVLYGSMLAVTSILARQAFGGEFAAQFDAACLNTVQSSRTIFRGQTEN